MHIVRPTLVAIGLAWLALPARAQPAPPEPPPPEPAPPEAPPPPPPPTAPLPETAPPPEPAPEPAPPPAPAPAPPSEPSPTPPYEPPELQPQQVAPPAEPEPRSTFEIYGFTMLDAGYDFGHVGDPNWQDVLRPTKLPAFEDQFGTGGRSFFGVRQTRFGVKSTTPTDAGEIKTTFEFELFGVGVDEGQTTFRLRHAYGQWGQLIAGQTWSPFMDIDVFPNSLEYWGPPGMAFFRNVQLAWQPIQGDSRVTVALERPGASADTGIYGGRIELEDVTPRFPAPDLSAEGRLGGSWGYLELAGILRYINWDDINPEGPDLSGDAWGWGLNLSSNLKLGPALVRLQAVYGEGIENYMNDASVDIGATNGSNALQLLDGEALPILGLVGFVDMKWSELFTSSAGYSFEWIDNSEGQTPDAFHMSHYALANLQYHPTEKLMLGGELQYGRRSNNSDGFDVNDFRIQFGFRFNFSKLL